MIGKHWSGVFCQEGFGIPRNLDKAVKFLNEAAKAGNAQSNFQLFLIHSTVPEKEDTVLAYNHLWKAVSRGITFFDQLSKFFTDNYDKLAPVFIENK